MLGTNDHLELAPRPSAVLGHAVQWWLCVCVFVFFQIPSVEFHSSSNENATAGPVLLRSGLPSALAQGQSLSLPHGTVKEMEAQREEVMCPQPPRKLNGKAKAQAHQVGAARTLHSNGCTFIQTQAGVQGSAQDEVTPYPLSFCTSVANPASAPGTWP